MAKAKLRLPNGTEVQIEGTAEEVQKLLTFYDREAIKSAENSPDQKPKRKIVTKGIQESSLDLANIVNITKDCDEADKIERHILDHTSQVNRTLLPLYIIHEHLDNDFGLTSGEISKITTDLGIPISQPNTSRVLSSTAARYVIGDKVKKKGQPVRYKLSRRGAQYIKEVLKGDKADD